MIDFASELGRIVQSYTEGGMVSVSETVSELVDLAALTDVDAVISAVPSPLREKLIDELEWLAQSEGPYFTIIGGIYAYEREPDPQRGQQMKEEVEASEREEALRFETIILPRIKAWAQGRDLRPVPDEHG